jgi:hypothetical protein
MCHPNSEFPKLIADLASARMLRALVLFLRSDMVRSIVAGSETTGQAISKEMRCYRGRRRSLPTLRQANANQRVRCRRGARLYRFCKLFGGPAVQQ